MTTLQNTDIVSYTLETIIRVIGRRSSENFALVTIDSVLKKLAPKYNALRCIEIKSDLYSKGVDAVVIHDKINMVDTKELISAIAELLDVIVDAFGEGAGYFFIREIKDNLKLDVLSIFKEYGTDLTIKHAEHLRTVKEMEWAKTQRMKNSERIIPLLKALLQLVNRHLPEADAINQVNQSVKELTEHYPFLSEIIISNGASDCCFYTIDIGSALDAISAQKIGEAMHELVTKVGRKIDSKTQQSFVEDIILILGHENHLRVKELGVDFDRIEKIVRQQQHDIMLGKTLEALLQIMAEKTSTRFAVASLEHLIQTLREKHDALHSIVVDKTKYEKGMSSITILPEINAIESYELAKAIEAIIKSAHDHIEDRTLPFIEEFKERLGKTMLLDLEELGVNFHLLTLQLR